MVVPRPPQERPDERQSEHRARLLTRLTALGIGGLLDKDCFTGDCFRDNAPALTAPLPENVPALAVYSRQDRVAPWELCLDPYAEHVEITGGHNGLLVNPDFYTALAPRLDHWSATGSPVRRGRRRYAPAAAR